MRSLRRQLYFSTACVVSLAALYAEPVSAKITVTSAFISACILQVGGVSTQGTTIKLDSQFSTPISSGKFIFVLKNYHPDDCIVSLKTNVGTDPAVDAVVAFCGLRGLTP